MEYISSSLMAWGGFNALVLAVLGLAAFLRRSEPLIVEDE
jgi:hypothetical protein